MLPPLIGITTAHMPSRHGLPMNAVAVQYVRALTRAGAAPVLIPLDVPQATLDAIFTRLDGILFTGGGDIDPGRFNGEPHPKVAEVDPVRDEVEIALVRRVIERNVPFFGICRGHQVINVALGGTLYTHISDQHPNALEHARRDQARDFLAHPVQVSEGSRLSRLVDRPILQVNSLHHQGVREVAAGLKAVAFAPDGLVEALELPEHPFGLSVQWHPEWLPDEASAALFRHFVEACQG